METLNHKLKNWLNSKDIKEIHKNNKAYGVIAYYICLLEKCKSIPESVEQFPTFEDIRNELVADHDKKNEDATLKLEQQKGLYHVAFLRTMGYCELIPRLCIKNNQITCDDHIIIQPQKSGALDIKQYYSQAINGSIELAQRYIQKGYSINKEELEQKIKAKDPQYVRYLPYYSLMEIFRTCLDRPPGEPGKPFSSITRHKQIFLDIVYLSLIKQNLLHINQKHNDLINLNNYYHYAWPDRNDLKEILFDHYFNILTVVLNDLLLNENSICYYRTFKNKTIESMIHEILEKDEIDLGKVHRLSIEILASEQRILLKNSHLLNSNHELRFFRNTLIELIYHHPRVCHFCSSNECYHSAQDPGRIISCSGDFNYKQSHSVFSVYYTRRHNELQTKNARRSADLRQILLQPANYTLLFDSSEGRLADTGTFRDFLKRYKETDLHFTTIFPELRAIKKIEEQAMILFSSYRNTNCIVHLIIDYNPVDTSSREAHYYVWGDFWNNPESKLKLIEKYRNEYKKCDDPAIQNVYQEWLKYLELSLSAANRQTWQKLTKEEREDLLSLEISNHEGFSG